MATTETITKTMIIFNKKSGIARTQIEGLKPILSMYLLNNLKPSEIAIIFEEDGTIIECYKRLSKDSVPKKFKINAKNMNEISDFS